MFLALKFQLLAPQHLNQHNKCVLTEQQQNFLSHNEIWGLLHYVYVHNALHPDLLLSVKPTAQNGLHWQYHQWL
jgi:hypothetical protein